jgi:hypothetical protein
VIESQFESSELTLTVHVIPSELVITRFPVPESATAANIPRDGAHTTDCQLKSDDGNTVEAVRLVHVWEVTAAKVLVGNTKIKTRIVKIAFKKYRFALFSICKLYNKKLFVTIFAHFAFF